MDINVLKLRERHMSKNIFKVFCKNLFSAQYHLLAKADFLCSTFRSCLSLRLQGCSPAQGFKTSGPCYFRARQIGSLRFGKNVCFLAGQRTNRVGLTNPVILEAVDNGIIEIGDFSGGSSVVISSRSRVTIGTHVSLGGNVRIFDHDFHSMDAEIRKSPEDQKNVKSLPVYIGNDVFVGTNAMILKGVTIGERAIIAAGSVVTKNVPAGEVWGGNPARCLKAGTS